MNTESMKELEDLESTMDFRTIFGRVSDVKESVSESRFERVDALRVMVFAQGSLTQSSGHADLGCDDMFTGVGGWDGVLVPGIKLPEGSRKVNRSSSPAALWEFRVVHWVIQ